MRKRLLVTVLVVLALALACQADSPTPSPTPSDDLPEDSLAYLRLLERYLVPMWGDPVTVYPQALPDGFGMEIPLPQEGELARSVVRRIGSSREDILVYIDASTGPEEAVAFYAERFAEAGWGEPEVDWDAGGFVETDTPFIKMFCSVVCITYFIFFLMG